MSRRIRLVLALAAVGIVAAATAMLTSVSGGSYSGFSSTMPPDSVGLRVETQSIDPQAGTMSLVLVPRASGAFGENLPNGAFYTSPVLYSLDVASGDSRVEVPGSSVAGGIPGMIVLDGNEVNYPFDSYSAALFTSAASAATGTSGKAPEFVLEDGVGLIPGFDLQAKLTSFLNGQDDQKSLSSDRQAGFGYVTWGIQRSFATKFIAILIACLMLMGAIVSILITWAIVRGRRPPSINAMVWLAAFLFALFQVRHQLPGDPASGVAFDRIIFFPVVLVLVLLIVVNLLAWSTRDDWDMENPIRAIQGRKQPPPSAGSS